MTSKPGADARGGVRPEYTDFFECFNRGEYFRAHEVLEELWLRVRKETAGNFYKGLIQLAGAFVHVQKGRPGPALALLQLAEKNLAKYPVQFERLDVSRMLALIRQWQGRVKRGIELSMLEEGDAPQLGLVD